MEKKKETVTGIGCYGMEERTHTANLAVVVRDEYQNKGVGTESVSYRTYLAKTQGLLGFTAEVLMENQPMLDLLEKMGFDMERRSEEGLQYMKIMFR